MDRPNPEQKLRELGLDMPAIPKPAGAYVPAVREGDWVYTAGQLPMVAGELQYKGKVGTDVSVEEAYEAARLCALNGLAAAVSVLPRGLSQVVRVVKINGFVHSAPGFGEQAAVVNGASDLMLQLFGDAGLHARSSVGVAELPRGAAVEVEMILRVE